MFKFIVGIKLIDIIVRANDSRAQKRIESQETP